jgi:hypothetical protein
MATCKNSTSIDLDHVEDSEPERKRVKLQAAESKKRRRHQKQFELGCQTAINAHGSVLHRPATSPQTLTYSI